MPTTEYSVLNAKLGYTTNHFSLEGGLNNALSREYTEFLSYKRNQGARMANTRRGFSF